MNYYTICPMANITHACLNEYRIYQQTIDNNLEYHRSFR